MFDIIIFGSGTRDRYMILDPKNKKNGEEITFSYGSKIDTQEIKSFTGGGGTNVACALSKIGFKTSWWGMIGNDQEGKDIIDDIKKFGVNKNFVKISKDKGSNQSIILMYPGSERTILTYRGASNDFSLQDINFSKLKSKWIYIAPFGGKSLEIFEPVLKHAQKNGIKTMVNPGSSQIEYIKNGKIDILGLIDIISINEEEGAQLSGENKDDIQGIIKKIAPFIKNILIVTRGEKGCYVYEKQNNKLYTAGVIKTDIVDMTGAGDSFNSGFLAGYIKKDIVYGIQLGSAESSYNISNWGAKFNLLSNNDDWEKIDVKIEDFNVLI